MKKLITLLMVSLFAMASLSAQERIVFYNAGMPIHSQLIENVDSVCFQNNISIVHNNLGEDPFSYGVVGIDSIVFIDGESAIDTGNIIFITYSNQSVSIINPWANRGVTVTNNGADVTVAAASGQQNIIYYVSGNTSDGSLVFNSDKRFNLILHNLSITNPTGAAIKVIDDVKVSVTLDGTSTLIDGATSADKAAFDSEGQIEFSGTGTLNVTGNVRNGIFSNDYVRILNGTIVVNGAVKDGVHGDYFQMYAGNLQITNAKSGVDGDRGFIEIGGGTINIAVSAADGKGMTCDSTAVIQGGDITITLTGEQSKGIKANGVTFEGGVVRITGSGATVIENNDPSHCAGVKSSANVNVRDGANLIVSMSSAADGGKCINADGNVFLDGGAVELSVEGAGGTYTNTNNQSDSYSASCVKANGRIEVNGAQVVLRATGADSKGLSADQNIVVNDGILDVTAGGVDSKGLSADGDIVVNDGAFTVVASGVESKGLKADANLTLNGGNLTMTLSGNVSKGLKSGVSMLIANGSLNITASGSTVLTGSNPAYCSGIKADGTLTITGGDHTITCTNTNTGGRCISSTGALNIGGGTLTLKTQGSGTTYTSGSTTDAYGPICIKADGDLNVTAGVIDCQSTGNGGRGIKVDGNCVIGVQGGDNDIIDIDIITSGAPLGGSGGGGGGFGGTTNYCKPKGLKVMGTFTMHSGHLSSYCSQTSGDPTAEAIETKASFTMTGGFVEANSYDDAINSQTGFTMSGGYIWAYARGNDGIDNNGTSVAQAMNLTGGVIIAAGTEEAIDANIDRGGSFYINGVTAIGFYVGNNGMGIFDNPTYQNGQKRLQPTSMTNGQSYCIKNSGGTPVMIYNHQKTVSGSGFMSSTAGLRPPGGGGSSASFIFTSPQVTSGTYTLFTNPTIDGTAVWHGLYIGANATTSGNGTSLSAQ